MIDSPSARLTVDLDALAANHRTICLQAAGAEVAPVVKADAYGLGLGPVALRLHAEGARSFFVARLAGGEALRALLGPERPATIYVLDGVVPGSVEPLRAAKLTPVLNDLAQVDAWRSRAGEAPSPAALHVDTGINRLGLRPEQAGSVAAAGAGLEIALVMSHLACASDAASATNRRQLERFHEVRRLFPGAKASLANSAGMFLGRDFAFDMVRPGISLYGGGPFETSHPAILPVATLTAPVLQVRAVPAGESVGYGSTFTAERVMTVATVGVGYADGVLRSSSPGGSAFVAGEHRPLIGRVSMDLLAVDVTGLVVRPGDAVELFGTNLPIDEAAAAAGTMAYELLVRLGPRVTRVYRGGFS